MVLENLVIWYQKKIGSYDRQEWEKTVEDRILEGFASITLKNARVKTEFIDVDLVRGSTFPKPKPKQTFLTVIRLAVLRYFFLPLYAKWWVTQTSPRIFSFLLLLYMSQLVNCGIYSYNMHRSSKDPIEHQVGLSELLVPMLLSTILSFVHSQIVATKSLEGTGINRKQQPYSMHKFKQSDRQRRKKKVRSRVSDPSLSVSDRKSKLNLDLGSKATKSNKFEIPKTKNFPTPVEPAIQEENMDETVEDFYNNLVDILIKKNEPRDDDGFESFNGKSDSSEEHVRLEQEGQPVRVKKIAFSDVKESTPSGRFCPGGNKNLDLSDTEDNEDIDNYAESSTSRISYKSNCTVTSEWLGITTNSEECSYSSDIDHSDYHHQQNSFDENFTPTIILNPIYRISCTFWDRREAKKAEMSVLDISSCIIERVAQMPETCDYIYIGVFFSSVLSLVPLFCRLCDVTVDSSDDEINYIDLPILLLEKASFSFYALLQFAFGNTQWEKTVLLIGFFQRLSLTFMIFLFMAVAERTYKQRFLYAKLFSHLTSSRRARRSNLPHFRLNKVINIKTWLSVRSYLKRRGPQRSVDVIVSAAFVITLLLLSFLSVEWLKDSTQTHSQLNIESLLWSSTLGIFLLRFMTLGNKINRKYKSLSILITEQINLYLQIEQKPKKKDELMVSNNVLKLAGDLLKELDSPYKISGLSANPYLYTTIKVVILSALSGVLSEMLGFKLKLHKIKIK
ncbi:PHTF1 family protein [Megaselia abdita]